MIAGVGTYKARIVSLQRGGKRGREGADLFTVCDDVSSTMIYRAIRRSGVGDLHLAAHECSLDLSGLVLADLG